MNELPDPLLDLLTAPRMLVSLVAGVIGAVFLAAHVPWFSGGMGVCVVILSTVAGLV